MNKNEKKVQEAIRLRAEGKSFEEVAAALDISEQDAVNYIEDNIEQADTLLSVKRETFLRSSKLDAQSRAARLSQLQNTLLEEIQKRGLADVPTDKLISLYLKANESIGRESEKISLTFLSETRQGELRDKRNGTAFLNF